MSVALAIVVASLAVVIMVTGVVLFCWMRWVEERLEALEKKP